jgi:hypothetical protein
LLKTRLLLAPFEIEDIIDWYIEFIEYSDWFNAYSSTQVLATSIVSLCLMLGAPHKGFTVVNALSSLCSFMPITNEGSHLKMFIYII